MPCARLAVVLPGHFHSAGSIGSDPSSSAQRVVRLRALAGAPGPVLVKPLTPARVPVSAPPPHASLRVSTLSCALPHARAMVTSVFRPRRLGHARTQPPRPGRGWPGAEFLKSDLWSLADSSASRVLLRVAHALPRLASTTVPRVKELRWLAQAGS